MTTLTVTTRTPPDGRSRRRRWRGALVVATTGVLVAAGAAGLPTASAATVDTNAWYVLVNRHSGKALDLYNLATADGAPIVQWTRNDGASSSGSSSTPAAATTRSAPGTAASSSSCRNATDGTQLIQNADNGTTSQQFRLDDSAGGYVRLINRHSGKALDVWEWSTADGGIISQFADADGDNQQWQMTRIDRSAGDDRPAVRLRQRLVQRRGGAQRQHLDRPQRRQPGLLRHRHARPRCRPPWTASAPAAPASSGWSCAAPARSARPAGISLPSYTTLDVCGTINVTGSGSGDMAPVYSRGTPTSRSST